MSENNEKIDACPFCGKQPTLLETLQHYGADEDGPAGSYSAWFHIECHSCGISMVDEYRDDVVATWNTRAAPTQESDQ